VDVVLLPHENKVNFCFFDLLKLVYGSLTNPNLRVRPYEVTKISQRQLPHPWTYKALIQKIEFIFVQEIVLEAKHYGRKVWHEL